MRGMPFKLVDDKGCTRFEMDSDACAKYISELGGVPPSTVDELSAEDFVELQGTVISFFGVGVPKTQSTDILNSQSFSQGEGISSS